LDYPLTTLLLLTIEILSAFYIFCYIFIFFILGMKFEAVLEYDLH
jgi:hypothetical protein